MPTTSTTNPSPFQALTTATSDLTFPTVFLRRLFPTSPGQVSLAANEPHFGSCPATSFLLFSTTTPNKHYPEHTDTLGSLYQNGDAQHRWPIYTFRTITYHTFRNTNSQPRTCHHPMVSSSTHHPWKTTCYQRLFDRDEQRPQHSTGLILQPRSARLSHCAAADVYATAIGHNTPARRTFRNMAREILTMINDTTSPRDRVMVSHPNVVIDRNIGELVFRDNGEFTA